MQTVSVIIPTYNRSATLLRAVKSVLAQTFPVLEILVCDDGSDDDSQQVIDSLKDEKVKWISCGRNGMPSVPRNIGIRNAKGDWTAFLDSDDEWLPSKLEKQMSALTQNGGQACCTNAVRMVDGKPRGEYLQLKNLLFSFDDFLASNHAVCSSVIMRSEILKAISLFPEDKKFKAIEDYALWLRIASFHPFIFLNEPLVAYYDAPSESIRTSYKTGWDIRAVIFEDLLLWLKDHNQESYSKNGKRIELLLKQARNEGKLTLIDKVRRRIL